MKKVTDATFKFYCRRVRYWLDQFGIKDYTVFFDRTDNHVAAQVNINVGSRSLTFLLPRTLNDSSRQTVAHSALHEVIHAVLARLSSVGQDRFVSESELEDAEEAAVCQITDLIWNLSKPQRSRG